jgi:hypothetical protein
METFLQNDALFPARNNTSITRMQYPRPFKFIQIKRLCVLQASKLSLKIIQFTLIQKMKIPLQLWEALLCLHYHTNLTRRTGW